MKCFLPSMRITAAPGYACHECFMSRYRVARNISSGRLSARPSADRNRCSTTDFGSRLSLPRARPALSQPSAGRDLTRAIGSEDVREIKEEIKETPASARGGTDWHLKASKGAGTGDSDSRRDGVFNGDSPPPPPPIQQDGCDGLAAAWSCPGDTHWQSGGNQEHHSAH